MAKCCKIWKMNVCEVFVLLPNRLRRFFKKTETENRQEKTEKPRKTGFLSINNTETKFSVARAVAHLHVFLLGYEL